MLIDLTDADAILGSFLAGFGVNNGRPQAALVKPDGTLEATPAPLNTPVKHAVTTLLSPKSDPRFSMPASNRLQWNGGRDATIRLLGFSSERSAGADTDAIERAIYVDGAIWPTRLVDSINSVVRSGGRDTIFTFNEGIVSDGQYLEAWLENISDNSGVETFAFLLLAEVLD